MRVCVVKTGYFIAPGQKRMITVLLALSALAVAGCSHSNSEAQFSMAPPPPKFDVNTTQASDMPRLMAFNGQAIPFPSHISLSSEKMPLQEQLNMHGVRKALKAEEERGKNCRFQDRFDRTELIAYQWDGRNRLGVDVEGVGFGDSVEGVKLQYTLKLQNHQNRKEKCRYDSQWQGLIGSSYNEFFLRKENTVWQQLEDITDDAEEAWEKLVD
jgi:hypothetical protein